MYREQTVSRSVRDKLPDRNVFRGKPGILGKDKKREVRISKSRGLVCLRNIKSIVPQATDSIRVPPESAKTNYADFITND